MKQTICLPGLAWALVCIVPSIGRAQCLGDFNGDGKVTVNEIIISVNNAMDGCGSSGQRFVDNGDGTVTDTKTGLMWEKKENLDGIQDLLNPRDADNLYQWSNTGTAPDGAAFTDFLAELNDCVTGDGTKLTGGFTGHCDWRLPTIEELAGILDTTQGHCGGGNGACIDPAFGPTQAHLYWSATTDSGTPIYAWGVDFSDGTVDRGDKTLIVSVRAVRGGL